MDKVCEATPALEHVAHSLRDQRMTRQPGPFHTHPAFERLKERQALSPSALKALLGRPAVDHPLNVEQGIDALHRQDRSRSSPPSGDLDVLP
ncbi:hypothetical protein RHIZ404_80001 [Rhizobium sp. EC-SD404]|nr:hypothetical protein RHIZ404_80001 [Rhizobium sp. EC-SD404]